jgi:coproporphyrinogen III oxidase
MIHTHTQMGVDSRRAVTELVEDLQQRICDGAEGVERDAAARGATAAPATFREDRWEREGEGSFVGGWGSTRVIADGAAFEKGGVNVSVVTADSLPPSVAAQRPEAAGHGFFACGVSVVLHPRNPHAPTAHCNYRYFETQSKDGSPGIWWFGGGADLTPYYPVLDDVRHFHATLKAACDRHGADLYPAFKTWCDRYFYLKHRDETRGVGGIFYDYVDEHGYGETERTAHASPRRWDGLYAFMRDVGRAFVDAYFPLVARHALDPYGDRERSFQLLRRGRYVEFNLLYDRGTTFGLQSGGRTESILMSLPPLARWSYEEHPDPGSPEAALWDYLRPRDWFAADPFAEAARA